MSVIIRKVNIVGFTIKALLACTVTATAVRAEGEICKLTYVFDRMQASDLPIAKLFINAPIRLNGERSSPWFRLTDQGTEPLLIDSIIAAEEPNTYLARINPNCGWSDGQPVVANDLIAGVHHSFHPEASETISGRQAFLGHAAVLAGERPLDDLGIRAIDDQTLEIKSDLSLGLFQRVLTGPTFTPAPSHKIEQDPRYWLDTVEGAVSSGPFSIVEISDEHVVMQKNPYYCFAEEVAPSEIEVLFANNALELAEIASYSDVKLDVVAQSATLGWREVNLLSALSEQGYRQVNTGAPLFDYLHFNSFREGVSELEVRQALVSVWEPMIFIDGLESQLRGDIPDYLVPYLSGASKFPRMEGNREERVSNAITLLNGAGYNEDNPLELNILTRSSVPRFSYYAQAIASMMIDLPVSVNIETIDNTREFYNMVYSDQIMNYDIYMTAWESDFPDAANSFEGLLNKKSFSEVDLEMFSATLNAAEQANDPSIRMQRLEKLSEDMSQTLIVVPLTVTETGINIRNDLGLKRDSYVFSVGESVVLNQSGC